MRALYDSCPNYSSQFVLLHFSWDCGTGKRSVPESGRFVLKQLLARLFLYRLRFIHLLLPPAPLCACSFLPFCCLHHFFFLSVFPLITFVVRFLLLLSLLPLCIAAVWFFPLNAVRSWSDISIESVRSLVGPRFSHSTDHPPSLKLTPTIHLSLSQLSRRRLSYSRFHTLLQVFSNNQPSPRFPTSFMSTS